MATRGCPRKLGDEMKKIIISTVLTVLFVFTTIPVFAAEKNYDSNSVTSFYGKYEYKKNKDDKKPEVILTPGPQTTNDVSSLPTYKGQEVIIPVTGDVSYQFTTIMGIALLAMIFFKLKGGGYTEKIRNT